MTDDQKRSPLLAEIARGDDAVEEAEILLGASKLAGSVSRAYYGAFHYARALLLTIGEAPPTPSAAPPGAPPAASGAARHRARARERELLCEETRICERKDVGEVLARLELTA